MIQYCINIIICSGLLLLLYKLLLENEKMHVFKRFYLVFSIVLSLIAPLITIQFSSPMQSDIVQYISKEPIGFIGDQWTAPVKETDNTTLLLTVIYLAGLLTTFFFFLKNIHYFFTIGSKSESVVFNQAQLILVEKEVVPHSFLNSIFVSKSAYKNDLIENEILVHELTHVKQLHSLDILFARLLQCIFWFNPFFIYYTKAIQLNHEFIADEAAAQFSNDPVSYQQLLLNKASGEQGFSLASQFNYSIIKKRLVMITQRTSPGISVLKKMTIIPLLAITVFLFAKKETVAQKKEPVKTEKVQVPSTTAGASPQLMSEYEAIVNKHKTGSYKGYYTYSTFSEEETGRLLAIYKLMTKEQQDKQAIGFRPKVPLNRKISPTEAQLKEWADAKKYFVRINGWRIKNQDLAKHEASGLLFSEIYRPNKGSTDYGKYEAQINLMTKEAYARYVKFWEQEPPFRLVVVVKRNKIAE